MPAYNCWQFVRATIQQFMFVINGHLTP